MKTVRYLVSGRVQGVGFRWFVRQTAEEAGLTGYARNLRDGRVEVVGQGNEAGLSMLESLLRDGPPLSRVEHVEKSDIDLEAGTFKSFDIRH